MYLLLLLAQNLPTELQVCPHPQIHRVGVFWGQNPGGLAVSQAKILLFPHDPSGRMICQLKKYLEKLYVNVNILFKDKLPTDLQISVKSSNY